MFGHKSLLLSTYPLASIYPSYLGIFTPFLLASLYTFNLKLFHSQIMIMSPRHQPDLFSGTGASRTMTVAGSSRLDNKTAAASQNKPVPRVCVAEIAIKQLISEEKLPSSSSRPLAPVNVNIRNSANRSTLPSRTTTSCSPKPSSKPPWHRKLRSSSVDRIAATQSAAKANKFGSLVGNTASVMLKGEQLSIRLPQKLPYPRLKPNSSPYEDLVAHLSRHHFFLEAQQVEQLKVTPDYYLTQYLETARLGKCSLYHQTEIFLSANKDYLLSQVIPGQPLPETVPIDVTDLVITLQRPPTHLLAVHSDREAATLYAIHGQVLALQCVSIPFLAASKEVHQDGKVIAHMPTQALRVPSVSHFNTIVRWLYGQSTTSLLHELLPLEHIVAYLSTRSARSSITCAPLSLAIHDIVESMSTLSTKHFLQRLLLIQSVWKNGVALGIVSCNFWSTLDHAWNLTIGAMVARSSRSKRTVAAEHVGANELTVKLQSTKLE